MTRPYETTHPWLTFKLDLRAAQPRFWITLGEVQSKCQHISGVPLRPDTAIELHKIYLARGLMATTAIEGNTLTEQEVRDRIEKKLKLSPSREYLGKEIDNVLAACNDILKHVESGKIAELSSKLIRDYNAFVLKDLNLEPEVTPGELRRHSVGVGSYRGAPWEDCEYLIDKLCDWLRSPEFYPSDGDEIIYGVIKSVVAHVYLAWVHPFGDGNGRTARLLEVKFLMEAGVASAAAHLLSNHYNLTRAEYYKQLDYTSRSKGDLLPFIEYAVTGFRDQLREQIETIKNQQLHVSWLNYVHELFGARKSAADTRQRNVVLAMSDRGGFIKPPDIKQLTPQIAIEYAQKTPKTLARDLNRLRELDLIDSGVDGYRAKTEKMMAFLPLTFKNPAKSKSHAPIEDLKGTNLQLDLGK